MLNRKFTHIICFTLCFTAITNSTQITEIRTKFTEKYNATEGNNQTEIDLKKITMSSLSLVVALTMLCIFTVIPFLLLFLTAFSLVRGIKKNINSLVQRGEFSILPFCPLIECFVCCLRYGKSSKVERF